MNLHSMISALKPLKMRVLNVNMNKLFLISIITFISAHFVMKVNINDVLYQKLLPFELHTSVYQTGGAPNRSARGMLQEKPRYKIRACRLSKT